MNKVKIAIIGIGGRTGTMFAYELKDFANILGVGKEEEVEAIKQNKLFIQKKDKTSELFNVKVIRNTDFNEEINPDIIFIATKNPVTPVIKEYFSKFKEKMPALFLSQNGVDALSEADQALKEVFGKEKEWLNEVLCNQEDHLRHVIRARIILDDKQILTNGDKFLSEDR